MSSAERGRREELRLRAAGWLVEGVSQAEVARRSGVSPQAVSVWHRAWVDGGADALRSAGPPGAHRRVSDEGFAEVAAVLEAGSEAAGFTGQVWTLARVGRVITQVTGVVYAFGDAGTWGDVSSQASFSRGRAHAIGCLQGVLDALDLGA
ncbi:helix-turn-helix domain-containing protein (plasmid) [Embleya sp. NBC_00888]|uniref:helix-turn-helix domain-containing protein n=1 Tax=Embleya sp. NBC_00888 TaxID=2975960 RepID=UPI002F909AE7|nr:helix-turn-helix domain-containing protein [Embleya sp. NBC_00888]